MFVINPKENLPHKKKLENVRKGAWSCIVTFIGGHVCLWDSIHNYGDLFVKFANLNTVNSAYSELLGTMINSSLYPEFVITV